MFETIAPKWIFVSHGFLGKRILENLPDAPSGRILIYDPVVVLPDDPLELCEIVGDDAVELDGRSRLVVLLGDLSPLLVNKEGSRNWKAQKVDESNANTCVSTYGLHSKLIGPFQMIHTRLMGCAFDF